MRGARIPQALLVAALLTGTAHAQAGAAPVAAPIAQAIADQAGGTLKRFYRTRDFQPLWITHGRLGPQADTLLGDLRTAGLDGLTPGDYDIDDLSRRIAAARSGDPEALARAEIALSKAFARYVRDQRRPDRNVRITYADKKLKGWRLWTGLLSFYVVCSFGLVANLSVASWIYRQDAQFYVAGIIGVIMSVVFNYAVTRVFTWK